MTSKVKCFDWKIVCIESKQIALSEKMQWAEGHEQTCNKKENMNIFLKIHFHFISFEIKMPCFL